MSTAENADGDALRAAVVRLADSDVELGCTGIVRARAFMAVEAVENNPGRFPAGELARRRAAHLAAEDADDDAEAGWRMALFDLFAMVGRKPVNE